MKISVLIPSFNSGLYLRDALASVLGQGYEDLEVVVADGGSTDCTLEILASTPSNVLWVSEPDHGQSDALNRALGMASGDVIGWLNADDFYAESCLERIAQAFQADTALDVLYGDCVFVDANAQLTRAKCEHSFDQDALLRYGCFIPTTSSFFSRRVVDRGLLNLDASLHFVMDYQLYLSLANAGCTFKWMPRVLAAFRWHELNKSLQDDDRLRERRLVQARFGYAETTTSRALAHVNHATRKLLAGSLIREALWLTRRGCDMRWWQ